MSDGFDDYGTLVDYPFPLRPGITSMISLPKDLTQEEAQRVIAFIKSLATGEPA